MDEFGDQINMNKSEEKMLDELKVELENKEIERKWFNSNFLWGYNFNLLFICGPRAAGKGYDIMSKFLNK